MRKRSQRTGGTWSGAERSLLAAVMGMCMVLVSLVRAADNRGSGGVITFTDSNGLNPANAPYANGYVVHTFTNRGTLLIPATTNADVLLVGGGGGGGNGFAGGGGAGGMITTSDMSILGGSNYAVVVGGGGAGASSVGAGGTGTNSSFAGLTAYGGGGGGGNSGSAAAGPGGSGGGGSRTSKLGGSGTGGQGNTGGTGGAESAGGGGGAGEVGQAGQTGNVSGRGGDGLPAAISGTATYYAQGGCGFWSSPVNNPNRGGGGNAVSGAAAQSGMANTGGGGGGYTSTGSGAGNGGSGIVIVRYPCVLDTTAVSSPSLSPADNATGVSLTDNLVVTFCEAIAIGTGNITIKNLTDATQSTIAITSGSPQVTVSGTQLTINPTADLVAGKDYAIQIAATAITNLFGNAFAGIADDSTWNFTTATTATVLLDDFATDPNLATLWTSYIYYSAPGGTPVWNSTDQDLDLAKSAGNSLRGLYRTGATRAATYTVTLTVKALGRTSGTWGFLGLMITAAPQQDYLTGAADSYTLAMAPQSATTFRYEVRRTYVDGTANFQLYIGPTITFAGPYTLDITRNGDHYDFKANGAKLYSTGAPAAGDTYNTANRDSMVYYQIIFGGDGTMTATVDDFGAFAPETVPPTLVGSAIVDNKSGGPLDANIWVTYTVTFSEDMDARTVTAEDFGNAGTAAVVVGTLAETSPGVFTVPVMPTNAGTLRLQVNAAAVLKDTAGNALDTTAAIADDTTLTVLADTTAPTLAGASIVDDKSGGPILMNTLATYTVTFSEDMDAGTVSAADFGNAGTARVTIGTVAETAPNSGVFTVPVTPTSTGTIRLQVHAGSSLLDLAGHPLDTSSAITDDTTLTITVPTVNWQSMMTIAARKRDGQGNLLPLQSYDETIRRGVEFLLSGHLDWFKGPPTTLLDEQGQTQMPWVYYSNLQQDGTPFASAVDRFVSYPAFHHALLIRTFIGYWHHAGDRRALSQAVALADWNIAHSTPGDWAYGNLPYSTCQEQQMGGFRDGAGLMPDKAAIMGLSYLQLHDATGEAKFLAAAEAIGHTLSQRQRTNGTWPFRVHPQTQAVVEEYTSSVIYAVMLFEELDQRNGNQNYQANRDLTFNWLLNGPIVTKDFRGFYEDIPVSISNRTNWDCIDTILYLLDHRTGTNGYLAIAQELNSWIEQVFMDNIGDFAPAEGIREQLECNVVMGIHSLHWAAMLTRLATATGDAAMQQRAIQTANYITYYLQPDNRIVVGFQYNQWWYSCHTGPILYLFDFVENGNHHLFAEWIGRFEVGGLTGFADDPDGDGLSNGLENFLGTSPSTWNAGFTGIHTDDATTTLQHPQKAIPASGVSGSYEWSTNLAEWHPSGAMAGGTIVTITPALNTPSVGITTATATTAGTVPATLFFRLKVSQPP